MSRKKLLFVITEDWYYWSHRRPLARAAKEAGFDVILATRVDRHRSLIESEGVTVIPLSLRRSGRNPFREIFAVLELLRLYLRERPALVHHVAHKPVLYGSLAARCARVPAVVNALGGLGYAFIAEGWLARLRRLGLGWAYRFALAGRNSRLILQNQDDASALIRLGTIRPDAVILIRGSGVDLAAFTPSPEPEGIPLVLMPSRLLWDKGVSEFIGAAGLLRRSGVRARFVLAGELDSDNPAGVPAAAVERWRQEGEVEFWGRREDMPAVFAQSNVVCLPSYREGFPKALLEGAASGRAIVASDVPGCREIVRHGTNGLLVPARDQVALADALRRLIEDPARRKTMGLRSRELAVAEFSDLDAAQQTLGVYRALLEDSTR